ncbi:MAG: Tim44 domain-containing protein [Alphaproteobacteria bacterium]|nr:Tim44 domain-containing protein [Alphaproteobacteria bacterium]
MRRPGLLVTAFAALVMVLVPVLADAKPGGGSSSGSRGSRTYSAPAPTQTAPNSARPMERTATQPSGPQQAGGAARPGMPPQAQPQRSFMGALAGGLLMGGLIGMFLGGGLLGGAGGFAAMLGMLLQVALIGGLIWFAFRLFRRRQPASAMAGASGYARQMEPAPMGGAATAGGAYTAPARDIQVTPQDYQAFEQSLIEVNAAWSRRDLKGLREFATPEMVGYFANDYRDLDARGWRNETRDVKLEGGDLSEAWHEDGQDYATVAMRFSLLDATFEQASGKVVEGSTTERQSSTELWTFVRSGPEERWLLSAIQQTA